MQNHACFSKMDIKQFLSFCLEKLREIVTLPASRDTMLLFQNFMLWNFAAHKWFVVFSLLHIENFIKLEKLFGKYFLCMNGDHYTNLTREKFKLLSSQQTFFPVL